jgi:hypothetical protein
MMGVSLPEQDNAINVWNEGGEINFNDLFDGVSGKGALFLRIMNRKRTINFSSPPSASSWFSASSLLKLAVVGGLVYTYRAELKILARGVIKGARLGVERWQEREKERKRNADFVAGIEELDNVPPLAGDEFRLLWTFKGLVVSEAEDEVCNSL